MKRLIFFSVFLISLPIQVVVALPIANSRHNLSVTGPEPLRTGGEEEICVYCHTPHSANPVVAVWDSLESGRNYIPYSSSTAIASPGQPTGESILCLSCHDGTIARGHAGKKKATHMMGGGTVRPEEKNVLGLDLSDDHPISFEYTSLLARESGQLADPSTLTGPVHLDKTGQLQCTSCHTAHDDEFGKFLVMSNEGSALCETCHLITGWSQSSHKLSQAILKHAPPDPPRGAGARTRNTVAENACGNCHVPHTAGSRQRLLIHAVEEDNCLTCHDGNVARTNIKADLDKLSNHPVDDTTGVHDPTEPTLVVSRHVECVDCHGVHTVSEPTAGEIPGALGQVGGITIDGIEIEPITHEYQLCFRCHSDNVGLAPLLTNRQINQANVRLEFDIGNPSFHPVAGPGVNTNVPSLIEPLVENAIIGCGDCHNNNDSSAANGKGANGPHGSIYPPLLVREYQTQDNTTESPTAYDLCYSCHDRNSILADESFKGHDLHVRQERTPCNVCHDPHGISLTQGNEINNSHLINFDTTVVFPNANGELRFEDNGTLTGACWLSCHGSDHDNKSY